MQKDKVLEAMNERGYISNLQAIGMYILRLGAVIEKLRKDMYIGGCYGCHLTNLSPSERHRKAKIYYYFPATNIKSNINNEVTLIKFI